MINQQQDPHAWLAVREAAARQRARLHRQAALKNVKSAVGLGSKAASAVAGGEPSSIRSGMSESEPSSIQSGMSGMVKRFPWLAVGTAAIGGFMLVPPSRSSKAGKAKSGAAETGTVPKLITTSKLLVLARFVDSVTRLSRSTGFANLIRPEPVANSVEPVEAVNRAS